MRVIIKMRTTIVMIFGVANGNVRKNGCVTFGIKVLGRRKFFHYFLSKLAVQYGAI